jgi:N-acetyl-gamma-glutamyl-phosphate reductase
MVKADKKIKVGILGVRGYTGAETLKILLKHQKIESIKLFSTEEEGKVQDIIPSLRKYEIIEKVEKFSEEKVDGLDVVFLCTEQNKAHKIVAKLVELGIKTLVIDLSPDFRFKNKEEYKRIYGFEHAVPNLLDKTAYGLPELYREEVKEAEIIANPGCYPTASILALAPLLKYAKEKKIKVLDVIIDAKSGVTGAGRKALPHLTLGYLSENLKVYAWVEHRHVPEMKEKIQDLFGESPEILFSAQLIPAKRGILETIWVKLDQEPEDDLIRYYEDFTKENFFFDFWYEEFPDIYSTTGTNFIRVGMRKSKNYAILVSVIDNLIKGASGQAVQNMNIKFGFKENEGLELQPYFL